MAEDNVDLYWLPLGAGGHFVRRNGRAYEAVAAKAARRRPADLYHAALQVTCASERWVIEMTPVRRGDRAERGVVAEGAVGASWAGRWRIFRYEVRRWRGGEIPDVREAVASPERLSADPAHARRILDLVEQVPTPVWGRDALHTGDMWNSNSLVAWLIARAGIEVAAVQPPAGGRAPGWLAGLALARRQEGQPTGDAERSATPGNA